MLALVNARPLVEGRFLSDQAVVIAGGRIAAVMPEAELAPSVERRDLGGTRLVPGLIDTQVNGGGDVMFNDAPSVESIRRIGAAHARFGTTGFLPTLISDDLDVIRAGIAAVDRAIVEGVPGVLGIHVEGPFISTARKGIHDADKIRSLDAEGIAVLTSLKRGCTLVTLAPELVGPEAIGRLAAAGVIVSAGHTAGSYAEVTAAVDAGLTGFTHLFNAMTQLGSREPGAVGAGLAAETAWCALIVDGVHVSPVTLRLALRCKPANRFMLVTDAMPPLGGSNDRFSISGREIRAVDGRLVDETGTLAGADLDMIAAVRNAHEMLGLPIETAFAMGSANPAAFLGLGGEVGQIAPNYRASLITVTEDWRVSALWIDGVEQRLATA